ncbi:hypothetical protein QTG54_016351 [Skeletonema marinoi]|uniref:Uncharacterized protein n=1 Tax=Skeletonema marinoi TaxID=267567 RepID=A0AAD9D4W8_9STRA|nr:hypothetical protein QTG54_016351 [Skeletonema marinoi]
MIFVKRRIPMRRF